MTTVVSHVETVQRHVWTVPCTTYEGNGYTTVIGEVLAAYGMAETEATSRGINTRCDDWLTVAPSDEEIRLYFDVVMKPPF
jgi:hypothetical protein